jgi:hypothetical protein
MGLLRIFRPRPFAGVLVLLLAGCGTHATAGGTSSNPSSTASITGSQNDDTSSPPIEGTGPESPQSPANGGGGGVAVSVPSLPIGNDNQYGDDSGNDECIAVRWLGTVSQPGVTVTITGIVVVGGQFTMISPAAAGCPSAVCVGFKFSSANTAAGTDCYVGVQYTGSPLTNFDPPAKGSLGFAGELSCPNVDLTTCQRYSAGITGNPSVPITYYGPTSPGSGSPGSGSP